MKTHLRLLPHSMLLVSLSLTGCGKKQTNQASTKVVGSGKPSEDNEIPDGYLDQKRVSFQDSVVLQSEIADVEIANETIPDAIIGIKKFDREIFESSNKFITIGPAVEIEAQKEGDLLDTTLVQKDFRVTLKQIKMFPASLIIVLRIDLSNPDRIMVIENKDIEINLDKSLISFLTRKVNSAYVAAVRSPSLQEFKNLTALAIDSVSVELVSNLGGCQVGIFGHNFTAGDKAYIGGQPCSKTEFVSPSEILCTVPNISNVVGSSDIIIIGSSGVMHLGKNVIELAAPVNICDQGSWDGTCTITSDHGEIENHSVLGGPGNLEIVGEGTFKTAALEKIHLCMGGDITISSKVFANFAHLQGHKITIAESGEINVSGLGGKGGPYGAENDALNVPDQTSAPGQGGAGGGGGGHYGNGGRGFQADVSIFTSHGGSPSYGSPEQPTYFGSGGGGMFFGCGSGGDGGGIDWLKMRVVDLFLLGGQSLQTVLIRDVPKLRTIALLLCDVSDPK